VGGHSILYPPQSLRMFLLFVNVFRHYDGVSTVSQFASNEQLRLSLNMALEVFSLLETLNRSLQSTYQTVAGMCAAVLEVIEGLTALRNEEEFDRLLQAVCATATYLDLEAIMVPRQRKTTRRFTGAAEAHVATTVANHYRPQFFLLIDTAKRTFW